MSMTDPIADMLTRIRNAQQANKVDVTIDFADCRANQPRVHYS